MLMPVVSAVDNIRKVLVAEGELPTILPTWLVLQ